MTLLRAAMFFLAILLAQGCAVAKIKLPAKVAPLTERRAAFQSFAIPPDATLSESFKWFHRSEGFLTPKAVLEDFNPKIPLDTWFDMGLLLAGGALVLNSQASWATVSLGMAMIYPGLSWPGVFLRGEKERKDFNRSLAGKLGLPLEWPDRFDFQILGDLKRVRRLYAWISPGFSLPARNDWDLYQGFQSDGFVFGGSVLEAGTGYAATSGYFIEFPIQYILSRYQVTWSDALGVPTHHQQINEGLLMTGLQVGKIWNWPGFGELAPLRFGFGLGGGPAWGFQGQFDTDGSGRDLGERYLRGRGVWIEPFIRFEFSRFRSWWQARNELGWRYVKAGPWSAKEGSVETPYHPGMERNRDGSQAFLEYQGIEWRIGFSFGSPVYRAVSATASDLPPAPDSSTIAPAPNP